MKNRIDFNFVACILKGKMERQDEYLRKDLNVILDDLNGKTGEVLSHIGEYLNQYGFYFCKFKLPQGVKTRHYDEYTQFTSEQLSDNNMLNSYLDPRSKSYLTQNYIPNLFQDEYGDAFFSLIVDDLKTKNSDVNVEIYNPVNLHIFYTDYVCFFLRSLGLKLVFKGKKELSGVLEEKMRNLIEKRRDNMYNILKMGLGKSA